MMLFRLLLLAAAVWILWRLFRSWRVHLTRVPPPQPPAQTYEPMGQCSKCGVHLPAAALSAQGVCGKCATQ